MTRSSRGPGGPRHVERPRLDFRRFVIDFAPLPRPFDELERDTAWAVRVEGQVVTGIKSGDLVLRFHGQYQTSKGDRFMLIQKA